MRMTKEEMDRLAPGPVGRWQGALDRKAIEELEAMVDNLHIENDRLAERADQVDDYNYGYDEGYNAGYSAGVRTCQ